MADSLEVPQGTKSVRIDALQIVGAAVVILLFVGKEAFDGIMNTAARAAFPFPNSQWSEGPLMLALHWMYLGQPGFHSTLESNGYDYGPFFLTFLNGVRAIFHLPFNIVTMRWISMVSGFACVVPLAFSSLILARRFGVEAQDRIASAIVAAFAVLLGVAAVTRNFTFATLHPDALVQTLVAVTLALYYAIGARRLKPNWVYALVFMGVITFLTKQNSVLLAPLLIAGLVLVNALSIRDAAYALAGYVLADLLVLRFMPLDMRAWVFSVPMAHAYEFSRFDDFVAFFTRNQSHLGLLTLLAALTIVWYRTRHTDSQVLYDVLPLVAVASISLSGFLKHFGLWNNLTIIAMFAIPYAAAITGTLLRPSAWETTTRGWSTGFVAVLVMATWGFENQYAQVASPQIVTGMKALQKTANDLCATKKRILTTAYPDMFFNCPSAKYALTLSYVELVAAYPGYYVGPTVFDRPVDTDYILDTDFLQIPGFWMKSYHVIKTLPTVYGWKFEYDPVTVRIWKRN